MSRYLSPYVSEMTITGKTETEIATWLENHPFPSVRSLFHSEKRAMLLAYRLSPDATHTTEEDRCCGSVDLDAHLSVYVARKRWLASPGRAAFLRLLDRLLTTERESRERDALYRNGFLQHAVVIAMAVFGCVDETAVMKVLRGGGVIPPAQRTESVAFWMERLVVREGEEKEEEKSPPPTTTTSAAPTTIYYYMPPLVQQQQQHVARAASGIAVSPAGTSTVPTTTTTPITQTIPPPPPADLPPSSGAKEEREEEPAPECEKHVSTVQLFSDNPFFDAPFENGLSCIKQQMDLDREVSYDTPAGMKRLADMRSLHVTRVLERFRQCIDAMDVELILYVLHENVKPLYEPAVKYVHLLNSVLREMDVTKAMQDEVMWEALRDHDLHEDQMLCLTIDLLVHIFNGDVEKYLAHVWCLRVLHSRIDMSLIRMMQDHKQEEEVEEDLCWTLREVRGNENGETTQAQRGNRSLLLVTTSTSRGSYASDYKTSEEINKVALHFERVLDYVKQHVIDIATCVDKTCTMLWSNGIRIEENEKKDVCAVLFRWLNAESLLDPVARLRICVTIRSIKDIYT